MQGILEITGLGLSFSGALTLGLNAYAFSKFEVGAGSIKDRLRKPIVPVVGLGIMTIGFGLQFVAELLS